MAVVSEYASPEELAARVTELEAQVAQLQEENERLKAPASVPSKLSRITKR